MTRRLLPFLLALALLPSVRADGSPSLYTTTHALQWVCEQLAGNDATVWTAAHPDAPEPEKADLVVLNGAGLEPWADALPAEKVFRTSEAVLDTFSELRKLGEEERDTFHHRARGITWLDPLHLRLQARAVAARLSDLLPETDLRPRLAAIEEALDELEEELRAHPRMSREPFMALHPALEGLNAFGWRFRAPHEHQEPLEFFESFPVRLAASIGDPAPETARALQAVHRVHTFAFDPGRDPVHGPADWPALTRRNFRTLTSGFLP